MYLLVLFGNYRGQEQGEIKSFGQPQENRSVKFYGECWTGYVTRCGYRTYW